MTVSELILHLQSWERVPGVAEMQVMIHLPKEGAAGDWVTLFRPDIDTFTIRSESDAPQVLGFGVHNDARHDVIDTNEAQSEARQLIQKIGCVESTETCNRAARWLKRYFPEN